MPSEPSVGSVRSDFPILGRLVNGRPIIYLDSACSTLTPRPVVDAMRAYYEEYGGCHGRSGHRLSRRTTEEYERSRERVARFVGAADARELVWTRNTTEGLNLALGGLPLKEGDEVVTTALEHNSLLLPLQRLAERRGVRVRIAPLRDDLTLDVDRAAELVGPRTRLVACAHTSNVSGATVDARALAELAHDRGALLVLDGAQSVPGMPVDVQGLGVDLLAFSLHKMLGPTGMGALYGRGEVLRALDGALIGGNTVTDSTYTSREPAQVPDRLEAGLQDYAGAVGSRAAVDYLSRLGMRWVEGHAALLNERLSRALEPIEGVRVLGPSEARRRGSICSFTVEGADCRDLSVILDEYANVCVRAGRHCAHSWYNAAGVASALRASFYVYNTEAEVDAFAEALRTVLGRVRR